MGPELVLKFLSLLGAATAVYFVGKFGVKPVWHWLVSKVAVAKTDFADLETRVRWLEAELEQAFGKPGTGGVPTGPQPPSPAVLANAQQNTPAGS